MLHDVASMAPGTTVNSYECCFPKEDVPNDDDFFVFTCNSEMTEVIIENKLQCGETTNDSEQMKTLVKQAMESLQVAFSQLKVMAANLWGLWLIAWAPSAPVGVTVPEQDCITSFDLALKHWLNAKLDTEFALPTKDNFIIKTKVRLTRLASRLRYLQLHAPNVVKDMLAWGSLRQSLLMKIVPTMERILLDEPTTTWQDVQAFITREIAKRDSSQVEFEGMVEVKEAVGQAPVKAASVDRFEASALLEALDSGSDGKLAEAAAVVKSQMASVCKKNDAKGFGLFATNNWISQSSECAEIIDVNTFQDCLHYTECVSLERTLSTAGLQFYHLATILFVDGTGLTGGKSAYRSISFLPQQFIRYVNSSRGANATYRFFHNDVMVRSMRQHLVKSGLTQETLDSILCQKERVSLTGKLLEVLKEGKWEIKIVALRRIRRGEEITFDYQKELMNLRHKETISEAAVSATNSLKSVRLTRANSLSTSASSSSDVARPMTAPSSSSASSSSRVGRQKTAPSSTSASSFSKASPQKKAPSRKPHRLGLLRVPLTIGLRKNVQISCRNRGFATKRRYSSLCYLSTHF
eukprot:g53316.t1